MGDPPKKQSYRLPQLIQCTIFALVLLLITIHQIYLYSEQQISWPQQDKDKYYLHRLIFTKSPYKSIIKSLANNKYTVLRSECLECVEEIVKFYAYKNSKVLIQREYHQLGEYEGILMPVFWTLRAIVDGVVDSLDGVVGETDGRAWVFWVGKSIPKDQIEQIKALQPKSSIIIIPVLAGSQKAKIGLKNFKQAGKVQRFNMLDVLKQAKFSKKHSQIYKNYYQNNITQIFSQLRPESKDIQNLDEFYDISGISKKCLNLVNNFCSNGVLVKQKLNQKVKEELNKLGVYVENNGNFKWSKKQCMLNYMIQAQQNCSWTADSIGSQGVVLSKTADTKQQDVKSEQKVCRCQCQNSNCGKNSNKVKKAKKTAEKQVDKSIKKQQKQVNGQNVENKQQIESNEAINSQATINKQENEQQQHADNKDVEEVEQQKADQGTNEGQKGEGSQTQNQDQDQDEDEDQDQDEQQQQQEQNEQATNNQEQDKSQL